MTTTSLAAVKVARDDTVCIVCIVLSGDIFWIRTSYATVRDSMSLITLLGEFVEQRLVEGTGVECTRNEDEDRLRCHCWMMASQEQSGQ